jgi:hypothetical protein
MELSAPAPGGARLHCPRVSRISPRPVLAKLLTPPPPTSWLCHSCHRTPTPLHISPLPTGRAAGRSTNNPQILELLWLEAAGAGARRARPWRSLPRPAGAHLHCQSSLRRPPSSGGAYCTAHPALVELAAPRRSVAGVGLGRQQK